MLFEAITNVSSELLGNGSLFETIVNGLQGLINGFVGLF